MSFTHQLRYAGRMLRLNPGFAAVAIVTLGLGTGATTAMFSVLDGVVLKSLRYPDVERIVAINTRFTNEGRSIWRTTGGDLEDLRSMDSFEALSFCQSWEMGVQLRSEEHTSELQSRRDLVCRLLLEKKKKSDTRIPRASI